MAWTDERVHMLREMWEQGVSASGIADRLGDVTRNAVIGKAHRLGLEGRPSPIRTTPRRPRRGQRAEARHALAEREARAALAISSAPMPPEAAGAPQERLIPPPPPAPGEGPACLWPIGDPGEAGFHFCGALAETGRPYCSAHCAIAYIRKDRNAA